MSSASLEFWAGTSTLGGRHRWIGARPGSRQSIVIAGLKEVDSQVRDPVHPPVLARNPPGPTSRQIEPQRFWLADALKGLPQGGLHQFQNSKCRAAIRLDPKNEI